MTTGRTFAGRSLAVLGVAALGLTALAGAAGAAVGPDQTNAPTSGTLTINKYGGVPVEQGGDLTNPLSGVEFTVTQVGRTVGDVCTPINLTDAADWAGLEGLFASQPAAPADPFCLTSVTQADATDAGSVGFNLAVGVYYVQETDPGDNPIVSPVPNFYASIPTSDSDEEGGWNYDVVADPKNQLSEAPTKTISEAPSDLVVGSTVTWTLTVPIPTLAEGVPFERGSVTDVLDSRLSYASSTVKIGTAELAQGTDYTLDEDGVTWTFTPSVLDAHQGGNITIELATAVESVGDGAIDNPGGVDDGYSSEFNGTTVPGGPTPYTYWGQLSILKQDDSSTPQPLAGAEFQVFDTASDGTCAAEVPATGSIATGTSDASGVVQWAGVTPVAVLGLWVDNSEDGPLTDPSNTYCVYETKIPAGHTAIAVSNPVTITPGEDNVNALRVINPKKVGPDLPLTGAGGTLVMTLGGLALIGVGAGAVIVSRRRRNHAA